MAAGLRPVESASVAAIPIDLLGLVSLAALAGVYWIVRFGGRWTDGDAAFMANAIRAVAEHGQLVPPAIGLYSNGYGYQVVSSTLLAFTGVDVALLQQFVYPLLSAFVVVPAWLLYRELLESPRLATFSTLLLLLVPAHMFSLIRASHEPLDRVFACGMLWLMVRSTQFRDDRAGQVVHVGLALIFAYGLIATNDLFGMSFLAALGMAFVGAWVLRYGPGTVRAAAGVAANQLGWITAAGVVLAAVLVFFAYEPAGHSIRQIVHVPAGIATTVLAQPPEDASPYAGVLRAWVDPRLYLLLSAGEFLLIGASGLAWLWLGWRWLQGRQATFGALLVWLLYGAFAVQLGLAILSDRSGAFANNLQYRVFTVFALVAAPVVVQALTDVRPRTWFRPVAIVAVVALAVAGLLKATNEPLVSNRWTFYSDAELSALSWADQRQRSTRTWVGPEPRLWSAYGLAVGDPSESNSWQIQEPQPETRAFIVSDLVRMQAARLGVPVPPVAVHNRVYDNGSVQVYRTRVTGPFER